MRKEILFLLILCSSWVMGQVSFPVDYNLRDYLYSTTTGGQYNSSQWEINKRYSNTDNFTLRYAAVVFDSIIAGNYNAQTTTSYPRSSTTIRIDSIYLYRGHLNVTGNNDTLKVTMFNLNNYSITGTGAAETLNTPSIWDTTIISNVSMSPISISPLVLYPNITRPQGESVGIRIDFAGDTANKLYLLSSYRDECSGACAAVPSAAGFNSLYYFNYTIAATNTNISGINNVGLDCNNDGVISTPGFCEEFYLQNLYVIPYITAQICTYSLSQNSYTCPSSSANSYSNIASVISPGLCAWQATVTSGASWLSTSSVGNGNGNISITVQANTSVSNRTGTIVVNGQTLTIIQPGNPCNYTLSPSSFVCGPVAYNHTNVTAVSTTNSCFWFPGVVNGGSWLSTASSGQGNGSISISVQNNGSGVDRTGVISVGGQSFTVTQLAVCSYSLSQNTYSCTSAAFTGNNIVNVTATNGCPWSATVTSGSWWLSTSSSGTGNGSISINVQANTSSSDRTGTISVGGQTLTITQAGACNYTLFPPSYTCPNNNGGTYNNISTFSVGTTCVWEATVTSGSSWLSTTSNGQGSGSIDITVQPNFGVSRTGTILVGTQTLTITQPGVCSYNITPAIYTCANSNANTYFNIATVTTNSGCSWSAIVTSGNSWLSTFSSGNGNGSISITVIANTSSSSRTGTIEVNGQTLTITQPGNSSGGCTYSISQSAYSCPDASANSYGNIALINTQSTCNWQATVTSGSTWLASSSSGTGSGFLSIIVLENTQTTARTGTIDVNGQVISITQPGATCSYSLSQNTYTCPDALSNTYNNILLVNTLNGCTWNAIVTTGSSWLATSSAGSGSGSISIIVLANNTGLPRTGTIDVSGQTLTVTQPALSTSIDEQAAVEFIIYPNPVSNKLFVSCSDKQECNGYNVSLVNQLGQQVLQQYISKETTELNVERLAEGVYVLCITNDRQEQIEKRKIIINASR